MSVTKDIPGVYRVSRLLRGGKCSQSKLALSNLGEILAGNVRLYRVIAQKENFHIDILQRDQQHLTKAECYDFLVSQGWVKSLSLFHSICI